MITFTIGCGVGILIGFVMFAFLSANREESLVRELVGALRDMLDMWRRHCAPRNVELDSQVKQARAAIAKTEGRAQ